MLIHKERLTGSTASGTLVKSTVKFSGVRCNQIYVNPATSTTTYTISITDADGDEVFREEDVRGKLDKQVDLYLRGVYTFTITNASADEAFVMFPIVKENG